MDTVTHGILIVSAICLTLGLISLRFWMSERKRWDFFALASVCGFAAVHSWIEVAMLTSASPVEYGELMRWVQIPAGASIITIAWFLVVHLRTGRLWLFWMLLGSRILSMVLNFVFSPNLIFRELTAIRRVTILGETLSFPVGIPNPWAIVNQIGFACFIVLSVDATVAVWRSGERRKALTVGIPVVLFSVMMMAMTLNVALKFIQIPMIVSPTILIIIGAMIFELNYDMHRSARLAEDLKQREAELDESAQQLSLSADAAEVGIWTKSFDDKEFWASDKWFELFGLEPSGTLTFDKFFQRVHPDDIDMVETAIIQARDGGVRYEVEYRVIMPTGELRWISSLGKFEFVDGEPSHLRGASVDITKRKLAETAAHELGRKLMGAQEKERARLARELHDDLSQSLALLSIKLEVLARKPGDAGSVKKQVRALTSQIQRLSSDVHRISHELHPAKLEQLGLEAALRGFCREIATAHGIRVEFDAPDVPRSLPNDISLCLYRVAQESLQNVVKHSGASFANVRINVDGGEVRLAVSDNGCGFDAEAVKTKEALGLVSMDERIRSVQGAFKLESTPGAGTKIEVQIPINKNNH
jgi:signal transduction histidine kinase